MNQYWIVVRMDAHEKSPNAPKKHQTYGAAIDEAQRLATSYPGIDFCVFQSIATLVKGGLTITRHG